jgi:NADPH:quinone reductase-like Zn-dependent oxidoreductase
MSRTINFAEAGGPEVLKFIETQVPAPGPHEARIKITAIGINRAESMWRNDQYIEPVRFLAGLGYDAAGIVDAVGKDVTEFAPGDRVSTISAFSQNQYFTHGEVILVPDYAVVKRPKSLSLIDAALIWMMLMTACGALIVDAKSSPFKKGPMSGAPSGVSHGRG